MTEGGALARNAGRWLLALLLALVAVSVLLPNTALAWMREHWHWFNLPMLWIENAHAPFNVVHAILFLALGGVAALGLPRASPSWLAAAAVLAAIATEGVQLLVPGRHARLSDALVDIAAGLGGAGLARLLQRLAAWRPVSLARIRRSGREDPGG